MNKTAIFWPMIAHVALVYAVYVVLGVRRIGAVRTGGASANQFKTRSAEPERSVTAANNILNQFELPVLFHIGCLALFLTEAVSVATLTFAWLFILSRCAHAWVHLTTNRIRYRTTLFRAGMAMVGLIWIWLALRLAEVV